MIINLNDHQFWLGFQRYDRPRVSMGLHGVDRSIDLGSEFSGWARRSPLSSHCALLMSPEDFDRELGEATIDNSLGFDELPESWQRYISRQVVPMEWQVEQHQHLIHERVRAYPGFVTFDALINTTDLAPVWAEAHRN